MSSVGTLLLRELYEITPETGFRTICYKLVVYADSEDGGGDRLMEFQRGRKTKTKNIKKK